jgi:DNA helicase-2/ATP-dependent DNA helicase PcrA
MTQEYVLKPARGACPAPSGARDLPIDYATELNPQQLAAVTASGADGTPNSGPMLVIAGAGSGKTRTLTYRVAWLVEHGVSPSRILLLTFTNKAAKEMLRRVEGLLPTDISTIWGGTFHHVANRVLRRHAKLAGYENDFTILDREDSRDMLDACLAEAKIDTRRERFPKGDVLADVYSLMVNTERSLERVLAEQYPYFAHLAGQIQTLRAVYSERKRRANAMDYDDLLVNCLALLQNHTDVRERYQEQFLHVLVDEYQDTNKIQADFVDLIAAKRRNLMVVGDDAQSIYSWRGADYRNILTFPERYTDAQVYRIEVNYRSLPPILDLANDAIKGNVHQFAKNLQPVRSGGGKPWLIAASDANQQAAFVAQRVLELRDEGVPLTEIAVLYRAHYHSMEMQMELTRRNIPFVITSGLRFFEQAHVKDVSCFLKIAANPHDELAFKRILLLLSGIGGKIADKLWRRFHPILAAGKPLLLTSDAVPAKARDEWKKVATVLNHLRKLEPKKPAPMIEQTVDEFYGGYLKVKYPNARAREEDLHQLAAFGMQFETLEDFLSQLALLTNLEAEDASLLASDEQEFLRLSTVHQAKGQEWRAVFVIGLCDGMFPLARSLDPAGAGEGEEEERRLFYVAITRAKDELYLTYPLFRMSGGDAGGFQRLSRFVAEVPKKHYQELALRSPNGHW